MYNSYEIGIFGEKAAMCYLKKQGYKIVTTNFKTLFGEIDIVARNKDTIVFIEVKARSNISMAEPKEYVDERKVAKIRKTAEYFMNRYNPGLSPSMDVIEVYISNENNTLSVSKINHLKEIY